MSEENKRKNELNDAELANVSGGDDEYVDAMRNAWDSCDACPYRKSCNHGMEELHQYNLSHDDVEYFWDCPFVEEAERRSKT